MRRNFPICFYSTGIKRDFYPTSRIRIFRKAKNKSTETSAISQTPLAANNGQQISGKNDAGRSGKNGQKSLSEYAESLSKIQMIPESLHRHIFPQNPRKILHSEQKISSAKKCLDDFQRHGIDINSTQRVENVVLKLPPLHGKNIEEHFYNIAKDQVEPYKEALITLVECSKLPRRPKWWSKQKGWTMYDLGTDTMKSIDYPKEKGLVLDVEVCVRLGHAPVLATAVGRDHWYSWVSPMLFESCLDEERQERQKDQKRYSLDDFIPLGDKNSGCKIVVGHNVSYDRARLREQYLLEDTEVRFIDTMSLHVCVSGITSYQRALLKSKKETAPEDIEWTAQSSLNSLVEVHRLYCSETGAETPSKEPRNVFVEGSLSDVRKDFQDLMSYCASDVEATHRILRAIYPMFAERFPHPVTLAGMLEMGSAYLPVNTNWLRYISESDLAYEDLNIEAKYHLSRRADEACSLLRSEAYKQNLWLWDEDWSVQELKMKQSKKKLADSIVSDWKECSHIEKLPEEERALWKKFRYLYNTKSLLPARRPLLPGYPAWYRKLCLKPSRNALVDNDDWIPGPSELSTGMQIAPKLLSLCWEGYPLHYLREHGWGFLVPCRKEHPPQSITSDSTNYKIPIAALAERCSVPDFARISATESESEYMLGMLPYELDTKLGKREFYTKTPKKDNTEGQYKGSGVWCNQLLEGCCFFLKLPHKNGKSFRVGNPLSRDFLNKFSENVLSSGDAECNSAARVIQIARMMSYWRNNRDRITGQLVVWLPFGTLPEKLEKNILPVGTDFGAICPQIVVCGTLTRRAMEPTWMTASNSQKERIGSELRGMVQAPPSYKIIGADVDSQELWIASVLGDAYAYGVHGATPLGWMTLSGTKSNGTDMHSVTAKAVGISRDHAKVINYARIYGAGQHFAEGLLKQFNPTFSASEAKTKAAKMFAITKGKRVYKIKEEFEDQYGSKDFTSYEASKIALASNRPIDEVFYHPRWQGGTESAMFNRLEEIATQNNPITPFLSGRLSRALETAQNTGAERNRFLPTRVNWVVQSGAVDFLHLMLVSMRWLMGSNLRFCLSFHDELRYLVKDELAYKAALAMHITNLLTRSFCSSRIGLHDLPISVAFFSSVEVDTALRKESTMDCKTPSNPHGLHIGYGIPPGENLSIYDAINKAGGNDLNEWNWIK